MCSTKYNIYCFNWYSFVEAFGHEYEANRYNMEYMLTIRVSDQYTIEI